ncbi:MAG: helix-turn-helix transcriptional regulator [Alphaproteobacteria bacterium]|nr:helix-turn-helix transcriptional regulator [Alphaproteobacteria bacterium]
MPHPIDVQVGNKVRIARAAKSYSQEKLAHILGVSFQQVQKYEKGTNRISASRLWEISEALDTDISYFFEDQKASGGQSAENLRNRTISLANQIDSIPDEDIRNQILNLIKACSNMSK